MIEFDKLASVLMRRCRCDRPTALSALAQAYIECDRTRTDAEQSAFMLHVAPYRILTDKIRVAEFEMAQQYDVYDDHIEYNTDNYTTVEDLIISIVKQVPTAYKVGTTAILHHLLNSRTVVRKALSIEMTRKILQQYHIPNTSEQARQIFTFLTTRRYTHD